MALLAAPMGLWGSAWLSASLGSSLTALTSGLAGRLLVSVATSALLSAMTTQPTAPSPGLTTQFAQTGADNPLSFPLGTTGTTGTRLCPWLSHAKSGSNSGRLDYLTLALAVSAVPGCQLKRVAINGEWIELGGDPHPDYGQPCLAVYNDYFWIKWLDGSQTEADPMMLAKYGTHPDHPWSADMIGEGMCIAYLTFFYNKDKYNSLPTVVVETTGIPLYDPRKDDTAGGTGSHRWDTPSTWEPSDNPVVQSYNIGRGIPLFTGDVWGGGFADWRLPLPSWTTAMNICDLDEGGVARYRTGLEVRVDAKPAAIMKELAKGFGGAFAEVAGQLRVRAEGPDLPVASITDADFLINKERTEVPFATPSRLYNGARSSYPEPESIYASEDAPVRLFPDLEAEDNNRRRLADLQFHAVPYGEQVQRLDHAYVQDNRREKRHSGSLQAAGALLDPLDTISWTSDEYGYDAKGFEVAEVAVALRACLSRVSLRESDPDDWTIPPEAILPRAPAIPGITPPAALEVPGWRVFQYTATDSLGVPRRGGLGGGWDTDELADVDGLQWQVKDAAEIIIANGVTMDLTAGSFVTTDGLIPKGRYWVRSKLIAEIPTAWSDWLEIEIPDVKLSADDFDPSVTTYFEAVANGVISPLDLENMNVVERHDMQPDWSGDAALSEASAMMLYDDFSTGDGGWVQGYTQSTEALPTSSSPTVVSGVTLEDVPGVGPVLQVDDTYTVMSEREPRPVIPGQKIRVRIRTRLTVDGSVAHQHYIWITCNGVDGAYLGAPAIWAWGGLTAADGWVIREYEFTPSDKIAMIGSIADATHWRLMVGLNGYPNLGGPGGAVQQFDDIEITDITDLSSTVATENGYFYLTPYADDQVIIYTDDTVHDLGAVFQSRVSAALGAMIWNSGYTWDTWGLWSDVASWAGNVAGSSAAIQISHTKDDPADPAAAWSDWQAPQSQLITARGYRFRIVATFASVAHHMRLSYATVIIDVPDRIDAAEDVAVPPEGLTYAFVPPFMDKPAIGVTAENLGNGQRVVVTGKSAEGVTIQILDASDTGVAGVVDILAKGYGRKEETT